MKRHFWKNANGFHLSRPPKPSTLEELDFVRLLQRQSDENRDSRPTPKRTLIRNGVTEKDLRDYLTANGYYGRSANILKLDLKALERPGWVQVFEFHVHAKKQEGNWEELYGVVRADERSDQFDVAFYDNSSRNDVVQKATDGMITAERGPRHWSYWLLMTLLAFIFGAAIAGAVLSPEASPAAATESLTAEAE